MKICKKCEEKIAIAKGFCKLCYYSVRNNYKTDFERKKEQNFSRNGQHYLGGKFIVDKDDYDKLKSFFWSNKGNGYAQNHKLGMLHRVICPQYRRVDHINRNTLDNRKKNLREGYYINTLNTSKKRNCPIAKNRQGLWFARTQIEGKKFYIPANPNRSVVVSKLTKILKSANRLQFYNLT